MALSADTYPLETLLAGELIRTRPAEAAKLLEGMPPSDVPTLLGAPLSEAIPVLSRLTPAALAQSLGEATDDQRRAWIAELPIDVLARALRRMETQQREAALQQVPAPVLRAVQNRLRFPERTAAILADSQVLALPQDLSASEAAIRVRNDPHNARYNVYVVDREYVLRGALTLRELLLASPDQMVGEMMKSPVQTIRALADPAEIVSHLGWQRFHAMPVIDDQGVYLGAIRYRTFRTIEAELRGAGQPALVTTQALAELLQLSSRGLFESLVPHAGTAGGQAGRAGHGA